jgi:uncharacterized protein YbjQ (UPF0145 family)
MEVMQVSYTNSLEGRRRHHSIGRVKASSAWRAVKAPAAEADRLAAVRALIREAEEYEADAIIGLDFEVDSVSCADIGGAPLRRVAATGIAVKFDEAARTTARFVLGAPPQAASNDDTFGRAHPTFPGDGLYGVLMRATVLRDGPFMRSGRTIIDAASQADRVR